MGRPKGAKNKRSVLVEMIAARFDFDPFEVLMMIAGGDWKGLGFSSKERTLYSASGNAYQEDNVPLPQRTIAAKEASRYLHSQKQSVQLSTDPENGFKVIIEDYSQK